jgi:hypothetical protein
MVKKEIERNFIKLHLNRNREGIKDTLYFYIVSENGKFLIQYPFLIFAHDWPTVASKHFSLHSRSFGDTPLNSSSKICQVYTSQQASVSDLNDLESFYSKVQELTGAGFNKIIDYYSCQDDAEAGLLTGSEKISWKTIGSCIVSTERIDFSEVAKVLIQTVPRPVDLLYYGIVGYGELERARRMGTPMVRVKNTVARHFDRFKNHPLSSLLENQLTPGNDEQYRDLFSIGGALVQYLVEKYGPDKFRQLYRKSGTDAEFRAQISALYNESVETLEQAILREY